MAHVRPSSLLLLRRFAYHPGPVMTQYQTEIGKRVDAFDGQSLTTTLWALAALSVRQRGAGVGGHGKLLLLEQTGCDMHLRDPRPGSHAAIPTPGRAGHPLRCLQAAGGALCGAGARRQLPGGGQRLLMAGRMDARGACTALALLHATSSMPRLVQQAVLCLEAFQLSLQCCLCPSPPPGVCAGRAVQPGAAGGAAGTV